MGEDGGEAAGTVAEAIRAARAAAVALWLANVPLGMWLARGYYLAAEAANATLAGRLMSLWLLAVAMGLALGPGLGVGLVLLRARWRRAALASVAGWCAVAQIVVLIDSAVYRLMRLHVTSDTTLAAVGEPAALEGIGISPGTLWWGVGAAAGIVAVEAGLLGGLGWWARRSRGFRRLRAGVARVPVACRLGVVGALVLPGLAVAVSAPRGPMLEVARHFVVPLAPPRRRRSRLLERVNAALRRLAEARRQPPGGAAVPVPRVAGDLRLTPRPSILFLSIESLRRDVVTPEVMPHLAALMPECVVPTSHYVEGNSTHHSFFAAIAGLHPVWYGRARRQGARPAPLAWLKAAGYTLHGVSSSTLEWVGMGEAVFPPSLFASYESLNGSPAAADRRVAARLLAIARGAREPFFAVGLFNATHFHYFYPPEGERFRPASPPRVSPLLAERFRDECPALWNRYRNSARYVDLVVGELVAALRRDGLLDRLILVIAADHGEAFLEDGVVGHGSSFHDVQVRIPVLVRYPGGRGREVAGLTQNADLFPSLFASMGSSAAAAALPGFRTLGPAPHERRPWAVCAMSAPHTPVDFLLVADGIRARFWLNVEPRGRMVLEATRITTPSGAPVPAAAEPPAARRIVAALAAWLDRQGFGAARAAPSAEAPRP